MVTQPSNYLMAWPRSWGIIYLLDSLRSQVSIVLMNYGVYWTSSMTWYDITFSFCFLILSTKEDNIRKCNYILEIMNQSFNSSPPSATYMCQWIGSALVQMMACRLFGAKPLSKPMLGYCQLPHRNKVSEISIKIEKFSFTKMHLKIWSVKWWPFCPEGDELRVNVSQMFSSFQHEDINRYDIGLYSSGPLINSDHSMAN